MNPPNPLNPPIIDPTLMAKLTQAPPSPVKEGVQVTIEATCRSQVDYYEFWVEDGKGNITPLPNGFRNNSRSWTPSEPGVYQIYVKCHTSQSVGQATQVSMTIVEKKFSPPCQSFSPPNNGAVGGFGGPWFDGKIHNGVDVLWNRTDEPEILAIDDGIVRYKGLFDRSGAWGKLSSWNIPIKTNHSLLSMGISSIRIH
ncbi:MAG: hypothetical protein ACYDBB_05215 [Armatimonadota bacterium]